MTIDSFIHILITLNQQYIYTVYEFKKEITGDEEQSPLYNNVDEDDSDIYVLEYKCIYYYLNKVNFTYLIQNKSIMIEKIMQNIYWRLINELAFHQYFETESYIKLPVYEISQKKYIPRKTESKNCCIL